MNNSVVYVYKLHIYFCTYIYLSFKINIAGDANNGKINKLCSLWKKNHILRGTNSLWVVIASL